MTTLSPEIDPEIEAMARGILEAMWPENYLTGAKPSRGKWAAAQKDTAIKLATAARNASRAHLKEQGYVMVPREPGDTLSIVGARSIRDTMHDTNFAARARDCYQAMLAAATKDTS